MTSKCDFPKCNKQAVTTYAQIPLCKQHADLAEFIRYLHYKLQQQDT